MTKPICVAFLLVCELGLALSPATAEPNTDDSQPVHEKADETALDPRILAPVIHDTRGLITGGIRDEEREPYLKVLKHARDVQYRKQKEAARRFLMQRIEQFRLDTKSRHARALQRAEEFLQKNPDKRAEYNQKRRAADNWRRFRLKKYREYLEHNEAFPVFIDLHNNREKPQVYHGELVTLRGHVWKLLKVPVGPNDYGLDELYEAWLYTDDSQSHPAMIVCTSAPEGMVEEFNRSKRLDHITVTGYFFKMIGYIDQEGEALFAPMIVGQRFEWRPRKSAGAPLIPAAYIAVTVIAVALAAFYIVRRTARKDRQFREKRLQPTPDSVLPAWENSPLPAETGGADSVSAEQTRSEVSDGTDPSDADRDT